MPVHEKEYFVSYDPNNPQYFGAGRAPSLNRLYYNQIDRTKLYTYKYVERMKAHFKKKTKTILLNCKQAIKQSQLKIKQQTNQAIIYGNNKIRDCV
jgi:hypothetical protein